MAIDRCTDTTPHGPHRTQYGPFGVKDCPGAPTADAAPYDAGDAAPATSRPLPTPDEYLTSARRLTPDTLRHHLAEMYTVRDRQAATIARQAEQLRGLDEQRDRAWADHDTLGPDQPGTPRAGRPTPHLDAVKAELAKVTADRDALQDTIDRAHEVRIDAHGVIWHATPDGHWHHRIYGTRTLERVDEIFGKTRPALLVDIDADDTDMGDPPADWRLDLGDQADADPTDAERAATTAHAAAEIADQMARTEEALDQAKRELRAAREELDINDTAWRKERDILRRELEQVRTERDYLLGQADDDVRAALGSPPDRAQDLAALADRIAQAIGDPGSIVIRRENETVTRWSTRAVLIVLAAEHADRSPATADGCGTCWTCRAAQLDDPSAAVIRAALDWRAAVDLPNPGSPRAALAQAVDELLDAPACVDLSVPAGGEGPATWHWGRSWTGHAIEDACPCQKAPCGLIDTSDPDCPEHSIHAGKSVRQSHPADRCPGKES